MRINLETRFYGDAQIYSANVLLWRFSSIYGDLNPAQRKNTWDLMQILCFMDDGPCSCCGDFNEILDDSEKFGGRGKL